MCIRDSYYRVLTELFMRNNSFIFIDKDAAGTPIGLYPISSANLELLESKNEIYARFKFYGGEQVTIPVSYTHLDVYKRQLYARLRSVEIRRDTHTQPRFHRVDA